MMKQLLFGLVLMQRLLVAQEVEETPAQYEEEQVAIAEPEKPKREGELQHWLFAAGSLVAATIAIVAVAWNQGSSTTSPPQR